MGLLNIIFLLDIIHYSITFLYYNSSPYYKGGVTIKSVLLSHLVNIFIFSLSESLAVSVDKCKLLNAHIAILFSCTFSSLS